MGYTQQSWVDGAAGATPINATRLNHIEAGIEDADNRITDLENASVTLAKLTPGSYVRVVWDTASSVWRFQGGAGLAARPGARTDIYLILVGGMETDRPSWANQPGDFHLVTATP